MIYQSGIVSKSSKEAKTRILEKLAEIYSHDQEIDLIIQVSNYEMFIAGLVQGFKIGAYSEILESISLKYSWTLMWLGILFAMGLYHFILFFFRKKRKSTFYFGIICMLLGIRLIIFGEHYLYEYLIEHIGWLSFAVQSKIYYSTTFMLIPVGLLYIESLYPLRLFNIGRTTPRKKLKKFFNQLHKFIFPGFAWFDRYLCHFYFTGYSKNISLYYFLLSTYHISLCSLFDCVDVWRNFEKRE